MAEHLSNKTKFFIGGNTVVTTLAAYQALTWVEIGKVYDLGEFGDVQEAIENKTIGESRLTRLKGSTDGGTIDLIVNRDPVDAGQLALSVASKLDFDHNFKMILPDKLAPAGKGTEFYLRAAVLGGRVSFGEADNVVRTTWSLAVNSDRLEAAATAT